MIHVEMKGIAAHCVLQVVAPCGNGGGFGGVLDEELQLFNGDRRKA